MRILLVLGLLAGLAACENTLGGFVQDSENVGTAVDNAL